MRALSLFLFRHRLAVLIFGLALTVPSLYLASKLPFDFNFESFFPENDPDEQRYRAFVDLFGKDDKTMIVALETAGTTVFTPRHLADIVDLTAALKKLEGASSVTGLSTAELLSGDATELRIAPPFDTVPKTDAEAAAVAQRVMGDPLAVGTLVSKNQKVTALSVTIDDAHSLGDARDTLTYQVEAAVKQLTGYPGSDWQGHVGGIPAARTHYVHLISYETGLLLALGFVVLLIVLVLTFQNLQAVVLVNVIVAASLFQTLGLMKLMGGAIDIMTSILPMIILIIGSSSAIHVISRFYEEMKAGRRKEDAIVDTISELLVACFLTNFTTAIGFFTLNLTNIRVIRDYGTYAAAGTMIAFILTMALMPALLWYWPTPKNRLPDAKPETGKGPGRAKLLDRYLTWNANVVEFHRGWVFAAMGALIVAGGLAASQAEIDAKLLDDLDDQHPIIATNKLIERELGGAIPLEILVDGGKPDFFKDPKNLAKLDELEARVGKLPGVGSTVSFTDYVKGMHFAFFDSEPGQRKLPDTRELLAQMLLIMSGGDELIRRYVLDDFHLARISARYLDLGSKEGIKLFAAVNDEFKAVFGDSAKLTLTGTSVVASKVNLYVVNSMMTSFLWAFGIITALLWILLRSRSMALWSAVPNIIPLFATIGTIVLIGETLKPSTAVTFSIAFGIAVDDTIHFLVRFIAEFQRDQNYEKAVRRTLMGTGRAMIFTTVVLAAGFSVGVFSEINGNVSFAILGASTLITALIADLFLTPALLLQFRPKVALSRETLARMGEKVPAPSTGEAA